MQSEHIDKLTEAMAKAQATMGNATLNRVNPHFKSKYADLAAIFDAVRKPLAAQGLIVTQTTELREGGFVLVTTLAHSSGQFIKSEYPLPVAGKPQEVGSALTYARRYSLSAITGIAADEDDDANAAQDGTRVDARNIAPRREPAVVAPPIHPETGEVGPHAIDYSPASNPVDWGGLYIAAIKTAMTADELNAWRDKNDAALVDIQKRAPKAHASIMKATMAQAQKFGQLEAAE